LLACIGLYGVLSYGVTTRTGEIGIRMALGAKRRNIVWMILAEALVLVGIGIGVGLPVVVASNQMVQNLLFNAKSVDVELIAVGAIALVCVAALAAYIPARRASRTDPMIALRYE
ncbi:MAG: FtsX-like permease family protein, partial [Blastocatellia bacterium]